MASNTLNRASNTSCTSSHASNADDSKMVFIYDPHEHDLYTEKQINLRCAYFSDLKITRLTPHSPVIGPSFEVPLPRWRNWVDLYIDPETRCDFLSSIHMGQLGLWKNLQRRLGIDYTTLHIKGTKSLMPRDPGWGR